MYRDELFNRILALIMQGLLFHCTACMIYDIILRQELQANLFLASLFFPLFLFAVIREKFNKFAVFLLMHILVSGISILLIPTLPARILIAGCMIFMFVSSFRLRLKPIDQRLETCPPITSICLFFIIYITAQILDRVQLMRISSYETFLYLILFAIYNCLTNTVRFLKSNKDIDKLPSKQVKFLNRIILSIFILSLMIGIYGMQHLPVDSFLSVIGNLLLIMLRIIVKFIFNIISLFGNEKMITEEPIPEKTMEKLAFNATETPPFLQILEQLFKTVFYLAMTYFLVKIVIRSFYELYQRFYEQQQADTDESEFLWKKSVHKEKVKKIYKKYKFPLTRNTNEKIRHMYKKYIRRQYSKRSDIPTSLTPSELEETIARQQNATVDTNAQQRLAIYEKARYSQWNCSKEEVEQMKQHTR